jgi:hypothetical protein
MYDLMLTGAYTTKAIALLARQEWGFRTPKKKRIGGKPLAISTVYRILTNPFYSGIIEWGGQIFPGKHEAVVTLDEFSRVRELLRRPGRPKPQSYTFAFTGMIRCGACGRAVTAEHKTNRYGRRYLYYHCSRSGLGPRCKEPCVERQSLERQIARFLQSLTINPEIERWVLQELKAQTDGWALAERARKQSIQKALDAVAGELAELTGLRIRKLLTDEEFVAQRRTLQREELRLQEQLRKPDIGTSAIEPLKSAISLSNRADDWFSQGEDQIKRLILELVSSNLTLKGKTLNIEAAKPFTSSSLLTSNLRRLGAVEDVRTLRARKAWLRRYQNDVKEVMATKHGQDMLNDIRSLIAQFEPELLQTKKPGRRSRRGAVFGGLYRARPGGDPSHGLPLH